jgi:hypothetical protein
VSTASPPVFFLDRNLGRHVVPEAMRAAGFALEIMDDHFEPAARDEDWLKVVGRRGWFVITQDQRMRYRRVEQEAIRQFRVGVFVLVPWQGRTGTDNAAAIVKAQKRLLKIAATQRRPFIAVDSCDKDQHTQRAKSSGSVTIEGGWWP